MERKILVFGADGQVGRELIAKARGSAIGFNHAAVDICSENAVREAVRHHAPAAIVNAAAYTAVDTAESEPDEALRVNRDGAKVLAAAAASAGVPFIHLSTDYVFDGTKRTPYCESDPISPLNVYGLSKAKGEEITQSICPKHLILRTSWVYSPYGTNFVRTMLRLAAKRSELSIVYDQIGCPTAATDIATTILAILSMASRPDFTGWGIYHYRGLDIVSWYEFAGLIFDLATAYGQKAPRLSPVSTLDLPTTARRPAYSVLAVEKLEKTFGIKPNLLREGLLKCLDALIAR